jgi:hypothetical protein
MSSRQLISRFCRLNQPIRDAASFAVLEIKQSLEE